jgi:ketosteroid isomerase-like protein
MKHFVALLVVMMLAQVTIAQTKEEKAVIAAVETMRKAMVDADKATLEKIADNKLTYGHSGGKIEDKATFVENIVNGNSDFVDIELTDQTLTVAGQTAIVRHKLFAHTKDKGKEPGTVTLYILLVWHKTQGQWKLLARQAVKVPV